MITAPVAQAIQRVESRKEHIRQTMEHIRHMVAAEEWSIAKEYTGELEKALVEQTDDANYAADNMDDE